MGQPGCILGGSPLISNSPVSEVSAPLTFVIRTSTCGTRSPSMVSTAPDRDSPGLSPNAGDPTRRQEAMYVAIARPRVLLGMDVPPVRRNSSLIMQLLKARSKDSCSLSDSAYAARLARRAATVERRPRRFGASGARCGARGPRSGVGGTSPSCSERPRSQRSPDLSPYQDTSNHSLQDTPEGADTVL